LLLQLLLSGLWGMMASTRVRACGGGFTAQEFHFGDFTLDQSRFRLQRGAHLLRLEKLPMELLILLVQRRGELVSREEIAERLWGKDVFLDVDHSINTAIRKVRVALRDDPEKPRFIETVVGRGYCFAAPVICGNGDSNLQEQSLPSPSQVVPGPAVPSAGSRVVSVRLRVLLGAVAVLALAVALVLNRGGEGKGTPPPAVKSLAVLPLKNLSGDPAQEYFADGMTEAVIGRLSLIRGLRVISRTSVMRFKDTRMSAQEIAQTLHVDALVEGSVIREGSRVRVTVQLIRGAAEEHIWAKEYEREYPGILALQDEVAQTIAREIKITMTPQERADLAATHTVDPEAHENYLKGRYYSNQRTEESLKRSITYFQLALARDPAYALAYCGLADAYALLGYRGHLPSKDALLQAKAAALKAVELDDTLAEAHASLAFIAETYEWDWATAEREYKRALELNPSDARAHHWYAGYLMYVGRLDEGIAEAKRARDLDPLSLPINNALAGRLLVAGRYDEALNQLRETLEMDPHFAPAHQTLGWAYLNKGKRVEAIQEFQQALQLSGNNDTEFMLDLGFAYAALGNREEARRILAKLKKLHEGGLVPSGSIAILDGALGDLDEAFAWLEKAYEERDPELTYLKVPGRRFEPLRHDARFQQLVHRIGLPQ
jgi:TolB-like protein/DNA-binding winged helix-turn-helix (wHTH) protein/Flp pilus assembly protein TadD